MEIKLIGQRLADKRQRKTQCHAMYMYIMQISYPCIVFLFHSQHIHKIRNNIRKHSQAFLLLFLVGNKSNFIALIMFNITSIVNSILNYTHFAFSCPVAGEVQL